MSLLAGEQRAPAGVIDPDGRQVVNVDQSALLTARFGGGKTPGSLLVNTLGATTVHTPAAGKAMTVYWCGLSSSENNLGEVLVTVSMGATTVYQWYMGNPGAFSHWEPFSGAANDALTITLSNSGNNVIINYSYTEA